MDRKILVVFLMVIQCGFLHSQEIESNLRGAGLTTAPENNSNIARESLEFFSSIHSHELRDYLKRQRPSIDADLAQPGKIPAKSEFNPANDESVIKGVPPNPINIGKIRAQFPRTGAAPARVVLQNSQRVREEINRIQNQLQMVREEITVAQAEVERLVMGIAQRNARVSQIQGQDGSTVTVPAPRYPAGFKPLNVPPFDNAPSRLPVQGPLITIAGTNETLPGNAAKTRLVNVQERLRILREKQRMFSMQLFDLRNHFG